MGQVRRTRTLLASTALTALALVGAVLAMPASSVAAGAAAATSDPVGCNVTVSPGEARCYATVHRPTTATGNGVRSYATPPDTPHGITPANIATIYDLPAIPNPVPVGTSQTVALVEAGGFSGIESELATYRAAYGLGTCSVASGCLSIINQRGSAASVPADDLDWAWETMMDVEAVAAACPRCRIVVVEADSAYTDDLDVAVETAARRANYVSMSWGSLDDGMKYSDAASTEAIFARHPDVTFVASTGDFGWSTYVPSDDGNPAHALDCGSAASLSAGDTHSCTSYPASSPRVVAAGGTVPVQAGDGSISEEMWGAADDDGSPNAGGVSSGCSGWAGMNAAQALSEQAVSACGTAARGTADVAALADGFSMYHYDVGDTDRGWWIGGGTSLAAPLLAAMYARAGNHTSPFDIYQRAKDYPSAFTDVTTGTATRGCPASDPTHLCSAGTGWDGPTGLGTPNTLASLMAIGATIAPDQFVAYPDQNPVPTPALQPVGHSGKVKVKGKARVRAKLKASYGSFEAGSTVTITWLANKKVVGHKPTLKLKKAWLNRKIRYVVTASAANRTPLTLTSSAVKVKR